MTTKYTKEQYERDVTIYGKKAAKRIKHRVNNENESVQSARHKEIVKRDNTVKIKRFKKKAAVIVTPLATAYVVERHPELVDGFKMKIFDTMDKIVNKPSEIKRRREIDEDLNTLITYNHIRHQHGDF